MRLTLVVRSNGVVLRIRSLRVGRLIRGRVNMRFWLRLGDDQGWWG